MYALHTILTMDTLGVDGQEPRTHVDALLGLITKFYPDLKLPQKQATVACAMRSSHSTPWNYYGYDQMSVLEILGCETGTVALCSGPETVTSLVVAVSTV